MLLVYGTRLATRVGVLDRLARIYGELLPGYKLGAWRILARLEGSGMTLN